MTTKPYTKRDEQHLLDFIDSAAIGLHWVAADGTIIWANKSDYEPLGYTAEEYIGHNITEFHADEATIADILTRLTAGERIQDYEARLRCKDSSVRIVHITSSVLFEDGKFVHTRCFTRDVTEKREAEERLKDALDRAEEALGVRDVFIAIAAHELRTPITPLRLQIEGMLRTLSGAHAEKLGVERMAEKLGIASRQVVRLEQLVNALLDVSRIASGGLELEYSDFDLVEVAAETTAQVRAGNPSAGQIAVRPHSAIVVSSDRMRVEQLITNLLTNAVRHGKGAAVELSLEADESYASFTVRDEGPGIRPEDQERIFVRFERATSERHQAGLGLGLWLVRHIAQALGGTVTLVSEIGKGSAFTVRLPRRANAASPP